MPDALRRHPARPFAAASGRSPWRTWWDLFRHAVTRAVTAGRGAPAVAVRQLRRVRPEHLLVVVMLAALGLFLLFLVTGSTGVGRGGR